MVTYIMVKVSDYIIEFLIKKFDELFNYDFTRQMEDDLDKISSGVKIWHEVCSNCNTKIDEFIDKLKVENKIEIKIDDNHVYMVGKHGPVIKCLEDKSFKSIKKDIDFDIRKLENGEYNLEELVYDKNDKNNKNSEIVLGVYENENVILRKGKFGLYVTWGEKSKTLKELGNRPIESINFEEVDQILKNNANSENNGSNILRIINDNLSIRKSAKGEYIFFKTAKMKKPSFFNLSGINEDYKTCDIDVLKSWIKDKHGVF